MFKNLSIKLQLVGMVAGVVVFLFTFAAIVWIAVGTISDAADGMGRGKDVVADILPPPLYVLEAELTVLQLQSAKGEGVQPLLAKLESLKKDYDERNVYWEKEALDPAVKNALLGEQKLAADKFWKLALGDYATAIRQGDGAHARELAADIDKIYAAHRNGVDATVKVASAYADNTLNSLRDTAVRERWLVVLLACGGALLSAFIGMMLIRAIMRPLAVAQEVAGKIAAGDLTSDIEITSNDELGKLLTSFKAMQSSIQGLIRDIKESTDTINVASKEIAAGNSDLSQRTEEQASSLEETASSMEELTSTVKQNTENAKQANQLAISASDVAGKGGEVVSKVVVTMDSINESSRKIVDIISVIDGIAFQTNILALNAAVEAARAGEQGRGFAVVAGEVRNLAQRSAAAAKEIKTLIGDSVEKVEGGSKLVAQAGQTMEEIVTSIRRVTDIMSEITAASVEQSQGIEQVNTAITQMDEVTQQNAALVEEAAAAAESLEEQAQNLSASVATFKVDNNATQVVAARASTVVHQVEHKAITARKAGTSKSTTVAKSRPKAKSGEDGEWQEF